MLLKKLMKSLLSATLFTALVAPTMAQEKSKITNEIGGQIVSGWQSSTAVKKKDGKTYNSNFFYDDGDTYGFFKSTYDDGEKTASYRIRAYTDGSFRHTVTGMMMEGDWIGKGYIEWEDDYGHATNGLKKRDIYVTLENDMLFFKIGSDEYFDTQYKAPSYLPTWLDNSFAAVQNNGIQNRFNALVAGVKFDGGQVDLIYQADHRQGTDATADGAVYHNESVYQTTTTENNQGRLFGKGEADSSVGGVVQGFGLNGNYNGLEGLDASFTYAQGSITGYSADPSSDGYKYDATLMILGVKYQAIDLLAVTLNYATDNLKYTVGGTAESPWKYEMKEDVTRYQLGVDLDFDIVGLSLSYGSVAMKFGGKDQSGNDIKQDDNVGTIMDIGVSKTIAGVTVRAGYESVSYSGDSDNNSDSEPFTNFDGLSDSAYGVEFVYNF